MTKADQDMTPSEASSSGAPRKLGLWIAMGLILGIACGIFFGEYCQPLQKLGDAYVGLLQMTVLPYLVLSLIGKLARLDVKQARELGLTALAVLACLWAIAILLIVLFSGIFPPMEGASFFSPDFKDATVESGDLISTFVPTNVFRSLTEEYVPAVVVFCLFFGCGLMLVPGKERLIDLLDLACAGIGRINLFLVRLAPIGLFTLSAAAAGTLRIDELSRLQAYLIVFCLACAAAAFGAIPLLVISLTEVRYRELMRAASEPMLTAVATGKLFVVLPQIIEQCEKLIAREADTANDVAAPNAESTPSVLVPLAYPFPHVGKILAFIFISFAAWYSGAPLSTGETFSMAATGATSSFASPLVSVPYLLDQHQLPSDLMAMFILPGFITMRVADVVGVIHLMALTVIVSQVLQGRLVVRWGRLALASAVMLTCLLGAGAATRMYLASTSVKYDLDQRLMALRISPQLAEATVYDSADAAPPGTSATESTIERLKNEKTLRVGFHPDHLPYSYFNSSNQLVGLDVELMHQLASQLGASLEFIPYDYQTLIDQLNAGQFDVAISGLMIKPERSLYVGFSQPYTDATAAIVVPDHRRGEFRDWSEIEKVPGRRFGTVHEDIAVAARRRLPGSEIVVINSIRDFFEGKIPDLDGLIMPAEEGAAWNVLYPTHAIVVPDPVVRRPVGFAVRSSDIEFRNFLDRWIDVEREDRSFDQLRAYWIEGGGTTQRAPRWSVIRDVLGWIR